RRGWAWPPLAPAPGNHPARLQPHGRESPRAAPAAGSCARFRADSLEADYEQRVWLVAANDLDFEIGQAGDELVAQALSALLGCAGAEVDRCQLGAGVTYALDESPSAAVPDADELAIKDDHGLTRLAVNALQSCIAGGAHELG